MLAPSIIAGSAVLMFLWSIVSETKWAKRLTAVLLIAVAILFELGDPAPMLAITRTLQFNSCQQIIQRMQPMFHDFGLNGFDDGYCHRIVYPSTTTLPANPAT